MNKTIIAILAALLAGCVETSNPYSDSTATKVDSPKTPEPTTEVDSTTSAEQTPEADSYNSCTVIGYGEWKPNPDYTEEYAIAIDSFGHEHKLTISDAEIGDVYIIRYGTVIEQTYEGYSEENDYYIIQFENGDLHEIESDDLQVGDEVTVYFWEGRPIRMYYGIR